MIVVIADDMTGGAEIAGIGLRYGLTVELSTLADGTLPNVQLFVLALNTRSMGSDEAANTISISVRHLKEAGVKDIFKKTDSVLRGHVVRELAAQLQAEGKKSVILCPANPLTGRTIVNGVYQINNVPIGETSFANDPEFPVASSNVKEILNENLLTINNIRILDTSSMEDLREAANQHDNETILAGSAAFFMAYLDNLKLIEKPPTGVNPEILNAFYVCGSTYGRSRQNVEKAMEAGANVVFISPHWLDETDLENNLDNCASQLAEALMAGERAILAIDTPILKGKEVAIKVTQSVSFVVKKVLSAVSVNELVVEGGATAFAIFETLNFTSFTPIFELSTGVVRMKIEGRNDLYITVKPGSYEFPETVWKFSKQN